MKRKNLNYILISLALLLVFVGGMLFSHDKNSIESQTVQASSLKEPIFLRDFEEHGMPISMTK